MPSFLTTRRAVPAVLRKGLKREGSKVHRCVAKLRGGSGALALALAPAGLDW
jgi:hypothetical protein